MYVHCVRRIQQAPACGYIGSMHLACISVAFVLCVCVCVLGKHSFEKLHEAKRDNYNRYGPIYRERLGRDIVQLFDPADIEAVFRNEGRQPQRPPLPLPIAANRRDGEPLGLGLLSVSVLEHLW